MDMRNFSICLIGSLFLSTMIIVVPAQSSDFNKSYQAVVSEKEAVFTFPVNSQQQYEWCPGGLQYSWNVRAQNGKDSFEFGFSLFTAMGASLCGKGDFTTLLNEGQFSIWKINKDSISIVPNLKVEHVVSSDGQFLNVMLKDQEAIKLIFSKKPKYIIFQSQVLEKKSSKKALVTYDELKNALRYPIPGSVSQDFGVPWSENAEKTHTGVDIPAAKGTVVPAMASGKVALIGDLGGDWGYYVIVEENNGQAKGYLHVAPSVSEGDPVKQGDEIGKVYKDHLHYNVCMTKSFCQRGALPTTKKDPKNPNDPLFKDGPFVRP